MGLLVCVDVCFLAQVAANACCLQLLHQLLKFQDSEYSLQIVGQYRERHGPLDPRRGARQKPAREHRLQVGQRVFGRGTAQSQQLRVGLGVRISSRRRLGMPGARDAALLGLGRPASQTRVVAALGGHFVRHDQLVPGIHGLLHVVAPPRCCRFWCA